MTKWVNYLNESWAEVYTNCEDLSYVAVNVYDHSSQCDMSLTDEQAEILSKALLQAAYHEEPLV